MGNPHTNQALVERAKVIATRANQEFGYSQALRILLVELEYFTEGEVKTMLELAKSRKLDEFKAAITGAVEFWNAR